MFKEKDMSSVIGQTYGIYTVMYECNHKSRYVAIADLIRDKGETLELYCSLPEDEAKFMYLFSEHPNII